MALSETSLNPFIQIVRVLTVHLPNSILLMAIAEQMFGELKSIRTDDIAFDSMYAGIGDKSTPIIPGLTVSFKLLTSLNVVESVRQKT